MERITAIGEILFDIYPETKNLGGAPFNFLFHIHKLTGKGIIISRVGHDILGNKVLSFLKNNGIETKYIQEDHLHPTGVTTVKLDEDKIPSFKIDEDRAYDYIEADNEINELIIKETDCLYFGSLAQRNERARSTISNLFGRSIKYFCDLNIRQNFYSKEIIAKSLMASDILKLNTDELKLLNDLFFREIFSADICVNRIIENFNIDFVAVTKGAEGSSLFSKEDKDDCKLFPSDVVDTLGAGDAFASITCLGYLRNWTLEKTNRLANEFAAKICEIKGALPETDEIYEMIKEKF